MTIEIHQGLDRIPDDFMQRPYEILEPYRKAGRVHHVVFPHGADVWLVTKYADVRALLQDPRVSKDGTRMNEMFARHTGTYVETGKPDVGFDDDLSQHMLNTDAPRHTRLRSLVSKAFTLKRMENFRDRIEELVARYLDKLEGRDDVDLVTEFAQPLPIVIICDVLGIPFEDRERFQQWAVELVGAGHPPEVVEQASKNVLEYGQAIIEMKRRNPADDMVSAMIEGSPNGDRLTDDELVAMIFLYTVAGHITSQHTLSNAILSLLSNPDAMERLRGEPEIMPQAIDELMRYDGGVGVATFRFSLVDLEIGDTAVPENSILALSILSAHRDDDQFPNANTLDLDRRPNGVLGFGHGPHFCIGQPLAKMQTNIALTRLLERFPHLRMTADPSFLEWEPSTLLRGMHHLPAATTAPKS
ncbi:cytochrome P450 family protein [Kribbella solani]|uniref:Cytochrome P450 n=1 Tax=Kribbella solani TaxID=236067 RepID=A0A841DQ67_9ACTN|nr:cytochrome P450 [Kribbella solani]MBB5977578.1 cytochrome P450 [Kribbella solani]